MNADILINLLNLYLFKPSRISVSGMSAMQYDRGPKVTWAQFIFRYCCSVNIHEQLRFTTMAMFPMFLSDEGPTLETLDFTIRIGSTPTFFIFRFVSEHCLRSTLRLFHFVNKPVQSFDCAWNLNRYETIFNYNVRLRAGVRKIPLMHDFKCLGL